MAIWQHTDEDGDRIELIELTMPNSYRFIISRDQMLLTPGAAVDIPDVDLFRLRDVIEAISVGDLPGKTVR